jgi:hypothetical protein
MSLSPEAIALPLIGSLSLLLWLEQERGWPHEVMGKHDQKHPKEKDMARVG